MAYDVVASCWIVLRDMGVAVNRANSNPDSEMLPQERVPSPIAMPLGISVLALTLGFLFVYPRQWTRGFLISDEAWYAGIARNLAEGRGFVTDALFPIFAGQVDALPMQEPIKQIGYPLVVAIISKLTGLGDQVFILVSLFGFALAATATWMATSEIVRDRRAATVITLATVGNPVIWSWWTAAYPESLFTALFLGALWSVLQDSFRARFTAGVLIAASIYFKAYAVLYLPFLSGFVLFFGGKNRIRDATGFVGGVVATIVLATVLLPINSSELGTTVTFAGTIFLYEIKGTGSVASQLHDVYPVNPFAYILVHPLEYLEKVARMVIRTKQIMEPLGGPAIGSIMVPLLLFMSLAVSSDLLGQIRGKKPQGGEGVFQGRLDVRLLIAGLLAVSFAFFWAGNFKSRYFAHLLPLMLAGAYVEFSRLFPQARTWARSAPRFLAVLAAGYFLVYPPAIGLWKSYRDPYAYLGRLSVVRSASYQEIGQTVTSNVPENGMVMTDMAHAINWYSRRPTVRFPMSEDEFSYLLEKFNVVALYEHPQGGRDWPEISEKFRLMEDRNGRFWLRRE